jgi:hypothetical protein
MTYANLAAFLTDRTLANPVINDATATMHHAWLDGFRATNGTEWRPRPEGDTDGDRAYTKENRQNPLKVVVLSDGKVFHNINLSFIDLAPKYQANNLKAAAATFGIIADAFLSGQLKNGLSAILEELASKEHDAWIERESYRKDDSYKQLCVPYGSLPEQEKEKDRARIALMFGRIQSYIEANTSKSPASPYEQFGQTGGGSTFGVD